MVKDDQLGVWVHPGCLEYFDVESVLEYERRYLDE